MLEKFLMVIYPCLTNRATSLLLEETRVLERLYKLLWDDSL